MPVLDAGLDHERRPAPGTAATARPAPASAAARRWRARRPPTAPGSTPEPANRLRTRIAVLVRRLLAPRGEPPVRAQRLAVVDAQDRVGVAGVDGEEQAHAHAVAGLSRSSRTSPERTATRSPPGRSSTSAPPLVEVAHDAAQGGGTRRLGLGPSRPHQSTAQGAPGRAQGVGAALGDEAMIPNGHARQDRGRGRVRRGRRHTERAARTSPARATSSGRCCGSSDRLTPDAGHDRRQRPGRPRTTRRARRPACAWPTQDVVRPLEARRRRPTPRRLRHRDADQERQQRQRTAAREPARTTER